MGDSTFSANGVNGKIVRSRKSNEITGIPNDPVLVANDVILQRVIPIERQSVEWGINTLKAPFGVLRLRFSLRLISDIRFSCSRSFT